MPEEQIFSGKDLNEILEAESLGLTKLRSYLVSGTPVEVKGIDLAAFLMMCGVENDAPEDAVIQIFTEDKVEPERTETERIRSSSDVRRKWKEDFSERRRKWSGFSAGRRYEDSRQYAGRLVGSSLWISFRRTPFLYAGYDVYCQFCR